MWNGFWPLYIAVLGASPPQVGLVIGFRSLLGLIFLLPSGMLSDRLAAPRLLGGGWVLLVVGLLLIAAARSWWQLLPVLLVLSAARAAFPAIDQEIAAQAATPAERTRAFTLIWTVGPSAMSLLTPLLGGVLSARFGLRAVFLAAAALTGVSAVIFAALPVRRSTAQLSTDEHRTELQAPTASFVGVLQQRPILFICLAGSVLSLALALSRALLPNFLTTVHGVTLGEIGWLGSLGAAGSLLFGLTGTRARRLQRPTALFVVAVVAVAVSLALLVAGRSLWVFALASFLGGASLIAEVSLGAALAEATPERFRSRAFALISLLTDLVWAVGPLLAGWLYAVRPGAPLAAGLALLVLVTPLCVWSLRRR